MIDEPVALKWNHAPVTLQNEIRSHWRRSHFTDISLVCDENVEIQAHQAGVTIIQYEGNKITFIFGFFG